MASSSMIHLAAPASSSRSCKYDVFLSFRGEDTRKTFVDHLYSSLQQHLIVTYKDDEALPRGDPIRPSLFEAIEESRIALVIFSKNYADSSWCLDELAQIMKCNEEKGLIVMPIFYDVDPSDVRKQKGDFGKAFAQQEQENTNKAQLWRNALFRVSNIAGWEPKHTANGHEAKIIKGIIDKILDRLYSLDTHVDEDLVGMRSRLKELKSLLKIGLDGVRMIGIWGIGGSGKTTLATSLYKEVSKEFQGHCIVGNIGEEVRKYGLPKLQEHILLSLFKKEVRVQNVEEGKDMIKKLVDGRKVLIVIDDVNTVDQLEVLVGKHNWYGSGSRIIITTRDEHLLRTRKVDEVCRSILLSNDEAIRLFHRHAYNEKAPIEDYTTISLRVVYYAAGLPLVLKVLGSFLYDKKENEWISTLDRLKDMPEAEIMGKLRISYDGLQKVEKELFLDIACFWRLEWKSDAMMAFEACGFHPTIGIEVLRQKGLITIDEFGRFDMHDMIQEMGHYIVRGEHPNNPEKHCRVWKRLELKKMCLGVATMENNMTEAIRCNRFEDEKVECTPSELCKLVSNMKNLRFLDVRTKIAENVKGPIFLSNKLQYVNWEGYYGRSPFPDNFQPTNLGVLSLEHSFQKQLWKGNKVLPHLKVLQLERMENLVSTPDFDELPCLQILKLRDCPKLRKIHPSLGNHTSLEDIHILYCEDLREFPTIVCMENLKILKIDECPRMLEFPEIQEDMKSLEYLRLFETGMDVIPSSIGERCTNLITLEFVDLIDLKSMEFNLDAFKQLKRLCLDGLGQGRVLTKRQLFHQFLRMLYSKVVKIPSAIVQLSNLQELSLQNNTFSQLDFSLTQFSLLKRLNVSGCQNLVELPDLPSSLTILEADGCKSLVTLGDCYKNCTGLCQVSLIDGIDNISLEFTTGGIISDGDRLLEFMLHQVCIANNNTMYLALKGTEVANELFTYRVFSGRRCRLELPENWCNDFSGFLICVVSEHVSNARISMKQMMSDMDSDDEDVVWEERDDDVQWDATGVWYVSFGLLRDTTWWNPTHKALLFNFMLTSGCGVGLVEKKRTSGVNETSTNSSSSFHYTPKFEIKDDSELALTIYLGSYPDPHFTS